MENTLDLQTFILNSINNLLSFSNGLFLALFIVVGIVVMTDPSHKENRSRGMIYISIIGLLLGGIYHWAFDIYDKQDIFTTLTTYLIGLLFFKLEFDLRIFKKIKK